MTTPTTRRYPRTLTMRFLALIELLWIRWELSSDEQWVKACEADGILQSGSLRYIRQASEAKRVRIAVLENDLRRPGGKSPRRFIRPAVCLAAVVLCGLLAAKGIA